MKINAHLNLSIFLVFRLILIAVARNDFGFEEEDDILKFKLKTNSIIPDILPISPEHHLVVRYRHARVSFGNKVNGYEMMDQPVEVSWPSKNESYYTLMMLGPDSPTRELPQDKNWNHWLVGNIPGSDVEKGDSIYDYCGSLSGYEAGIHRLVYAVFEQPKKMEFDEDRLDEDTYTKRPQFSVHEFKKKYHLGNLTAANFCVLDLDFRLPGT